MVTDIWTHQIHTRILRKSLKFVQGIPVKNILLTEEMTYNWDGYPLIPGLQLSDIHLRGGLMKSDAYFQGPMPGMSISVG